MKKKVVQYDESERVISGSQLLSDIQTIFWEGSRKSTKIRVLNENLRYILNLDSQRFC